MKRRIAASIDSSSLSDGEALSPWEQYIYPELGTDLLMGDVLRRHEADVKDPGDLSTSADPVLRLGDEERKSES